MPEIFSRTGCLIAIFIGIILLFKWINVLNEYERAVTFWLGRLGKHPKGPGLVLIFWPFERMVRISLRTVVHDVPTPETNCINRPVATTRIAFDSIATGATAAISISFSHQGR